MQTICIFCCDVYTGEKDTNTHTFKCKCLNKLCVDTQETGNTCFWEGNDERIKEVKRIKFLMDTITYL